MASVRRILIVKLSAMGDIIHALPITAALGEAYPHIELTWVVEEAFAPLLTGNPYLSRIFMLPKMHTHRLRSTKFRRSYFGGIRSLREDRYDLALDLQGLTKSAILAVASRAPVRLGYHFQREAAPWLVRPVPPRPQSAHVVEHYLDVARYLGADPDRVRFPFTIPEETEAGVVAMLCEAGIDPEAPFVTVNPAAGTVLKQWGVENYAALMDAIQKHLGLPVVLVTADLAVAAQVRTATRHPFGDLAGRTDLKQLAAVLRRGAIHICGDTGSGHLAAALACPVLSLIGPSEPERVCPYGQRVNTIQYRELCGSACRHHHCQYDRPKCLAAISVSEVLARISALASHRVTVCE